MDISSIVTPIFGTTGNGKLSTINLDEMFAECFAMDEGDDGEGGGGGGGFARPPQGGSGIGGVGRDSFADLALWSIGINNSNGGSSENLQQLSDSMDYGQLGGGGGGGYALGGGGSMDYGGVNSDNNSSSSNEGMKYGGGASGGGGVGVKAAVGAISEITKEEVAAEMQARMERKRKAPSDKREMTEEQKQERRERNREHAKRSRIRKKFMLECLQEQLLMLRKENMNLRTCVKENMPDEAASILDQFINETALAISGGHGQRQGSSSSSNASGSDADEAEIGPSRLLVQPDFQLMACLMKSQQNFTVSDPSLVDNPIVYASQGFLDLTGYTIDKVLGRNCRFLQGPGTDQRAVDMIRKGVEEGRDTSVCLLNYKADGTPFWNQFFVAALTDDTGKIVNYVGVQCAVAESTAADFKERLRKLPLPPELMDVTGTGKDGVKDEDDHDDDDD